MLLKPLARSAAIGLLVLASACGDDSKGSDDSDAAVPPGGKTDGGTSVIRSDAGTGPGIDAGLNIDGSVRDGSLQGDSDGSIDEESDGAVATPDSSIDAAQPDTTGPDATTGTVPDAATVADAATFADAATDAATSSTGDAGDCSVYDSRFGGCGTAITPTWVRFTSGYEVDRAAKLVWSPTVSPASSVALTLHCLSIPPIDGQTHIFDIPTMQQVRTLAAGCPATESGGACEVEVGDDKGEVLSSAATHCDCTGVTPTEHAAGGFCRPEVSSCDTLWARTFCGPNAECLTYQHWFYNVQNGSVVLAAENSSLATSAKGRCVTTYLPIP